MEEIWKPIKDAPGFEVSNLGKVRSPYGNILKAEIIRGQPYYRLQTAEKRLNRTAARLVNDAFGDSLAIDGGDIICIGKRIDLKGRKFCIVKYKVTNIFIPDIFSTEYGVVIGDPNSKDFRCIEIEKKHALKFIEKNHMERVVHNDDGDIWEMEGEAYYYAYWGTYRAAQIKREEALREHLRQIELRKNDTKGKDI